jgi:mitochondrial fission protein ELM1
VVSTRGSLHRVTPAVLSRNADNWAPAFSHLPRPYIAVLVGGSNSAYRLGVDEMTKFASNVSACARALNGSLLITPSRRTGDAARTALARTVTGVPHFLWDMAGENPYFGLLGLADFIVVTCDSVNMISEAASTGKPVYVEALPGGSAKSSRFLDQLRNSGVVRDFSGSLAQYAYTPLDDTSKVLRRVREILPQTPQLQ